LLLLTLNVFAVKTVNIGYHHTIETIMILRAISSDDYFFSKIKPGDKRRPMLFLARQAFAQYKDHPAVAETQKILTDLQDIGGQLFQGILYAEELPGTSIKYEPTDAYWLQHKEQLKNYMKLLQQFYNDAGVKKFLTQNKRFYDGAVAEARRFVSNSSIPAMEQYFGKQLAGYNVYVMPMCPYGWGFSASTGSSGRKSVHAIIAPVGKTAWKDNLNDYIEFGYAGEKAREHYRELVMHEFTHAFITDVLEQKDMKAMINQYDSLFTPALDSVMHDNGYPDWWGFVNEHIVRLGHIRVAAAVDNSEAEELRKADVQEYRFVLIPDGEKLMAEYESNRKKYKTINDFLPILIRHFENISRQDINAKLSAEAK
jgi:hypothetical protein